MVVVADLVARVRAEGAEATTQAIAGVGQQAKATGADLEEMARKMARAQGGTAEAWREILGRSGFERIGQGAHVATQAAERTVAAVTKIQEPTRAVARAATEIHEGFRLSESSALRFGAGIIGIGLGLNLAAGAASLLHQAITSVADAQLEWERSLVRTTVLYGTLGPSVVAVSQAQSRAPGLLGTQQEFLSANLNAAYLGSRFGLSQSSIFGLTSAAGRVSNVYGYGPADRADLQARALAFAEGGGSGLRNITGTEGTPLDFARRLGGVSAAQLEALTPQQIRAIQAAAGTLDLNQTALSGGTDQKGLIQLQAEKERLLAQAQGALQNRLEGQQDDVRLRALITGQVPRNVLEVEQQQQQLTAIEARSPQGVVSAAQAAFDEATTAVKDTTAALEESRVALTKLGVEAGTAAFRLLGFGGNLEDRYSIARGDVGAQAQGAVAARARMAVPAFGVTQGEIVATAQNMAYQNAWQNYVAEQAQQEQRNAIREELQRRIQFGPAAQRPAAARALLQAEQAEPIQQRIGEANRAGALVDLRSAETQTNLEQISLRQRERYVQLMRDTVDLRRLDLQQQQASIVAGEGVIRAQQRALPAQYALADAQFQGSFVSALARQRMGRTLRGQSVAGLPSIDDLIRMNVDAQFAEAELGPAALQGARGVEMAQRTSTAAGLAQQLTAGQLQNAELTNDLKNLGDLPSQTALMLEDLQNSRDRLTVQKELRDLMKDLVNIVTGRPLSLTSGQGVQDLANRVGAMVFGDAGGDIALPAPSDQPGARRGPY